VWSGHSRGQSSFRMWARAASAVTERGRALPQAFDHGAVASAGARAHAFLCTWICDVTQSIVKQLCAACASTGIAFRYNYSGVTVVHFMLRM